MPASRPPAAHATWQTVQPSNHGCIGPGRDPSRCRRDAAGFPAAAAPPNDRRLRVLRLPATVRRIRDSARLRVVPVTRGLHGPRHHHDSGPAAAAAAPAQECSNRRRRRAQAAAAARQWQGTEGPARKAGRPRGEPLAPGRPGRCCCERDCRVSAVGVTVTVIRLYNDVTLLVLGTQTGCWAVTAP